MFHQYHPGIYDIDRIEFLSSFPLFKMSTREHASWVYELIDQYKGGNILAVRGKDVAYVQRLGKKCNIEVVTVEGTIRLDRTSIPVGIPIGAGNMRYDNNVPIDVVDVDTSEVTLIDITASRYKIRSDKIVMYKCHLDSMAKGIIDSVSVDLIETSALSWNISPRCTKLMLNGCSGDVNIPNYTNVTLTGRVSRNTTPFLYISPFRTKPILKSKGIKRYNGEIKFHLREEDFNNSLKRRCLYVLVKHYIGDSIMKPAEGAKEAIKEYMERTDELFNDLIRNCEYCKGSTPLWWAHNTKAVYTEYAEGINAIYPKDIQIVCYECSRKEYL